MGFRDLEVSGGESPWLLALRGGVAPWLDGALGFRVLGFRVLGLRALGFRVEGFRVWGLSSLGFRVKHQRSLEQDSAERLRRVQMP